MFRYVHDNRLEAARRGGKFDHSWSRRKSRSHADGHREPQYATEAACLEIVVPATVEVTMGRRLVDGTEVAYGTRADVVDCDPSKKKTRVVGKGDDGCERNPGAIASPIEEFDQRTGLSGSTITTTITQTREVTGKVMVDLAFGKALLQVAFDYTRTTTRETSLSTVLAAGARYVSFPPTDLPGSTQHIEDRWRIEK